MLNKILNNLKEFFGETNEVVQSTQIAVSDRLSSPFYGYFIIAWIVTNWHFLYISFFIDQEKLFEKTGLLRNEYLFSILPQYQELQFWWKFFILPLALTILFFWVFPYGTRVFYRKSIRNQKALQIIELQENREKTVAEKKLVKEEKSLIKEEVARAKEEKRAAKETPEIIWEKEVETLSMDYNSTAAIKNVIKAIYETEGNFVTSGGIMTDWQTRILPQHLARVDVLGLINISSNNKLSLTNKGKYVVRRLQDRHLI